MVKRFADWLQVRSRFLNERKRSSPALFCVTAQLPVYEPPLRELKKIINPYCEYRGLCQSCIYLFCFELCLCANHSTDFCCLLLATWYVLKAKVLIAALVHVGRGQGWLDPQQQDQGDDLDSVREVHGRRETAPQQLRWCGRMFCARCLQQ